MLFPLKDRNPLRHVRYQYVTITAIAACVLVFLWQIGLGADGRRAFYAYGMIPSVLFGVRSLPPEVGALPAALTVVTSMFLHGGWMHLLGNMLYLWIFGDNVEDSMGHRRFIAFYLLCGIVAALAHAVAIPGSTTPTVGASGAISGVLGAYLLLHPKARIRVMFFPFFFGLPAWIVLGSWIGLQTFNALADSGATAGVAWWAHIGGFVAGALLVVPLRRRGVPLLDGLHSAHEVGRAMMARPTRSRIPDAGGSWRRR